MIVFVLYAQRQLVRCKFKSNLLMNIQLHYIFVSKRLAVSFPWVKKCTRPTRFVRVHFSSLTSLSFSLFLHYFTHRNKRCHQYSITSFSFMLVKLYTNYQMYTSSLYEQVIAIRSISHLAYTHCLL